METNWGIIYMYTHPLPLSRTTSKLPRSSSKCVEVSVKASGVASGVETSLRFVVVIESVEVSVKASGVASGVEASLRFVVVIEMITSRRGTTVSRRIVIQVVVPPDAVPVGLAVFSSTIDMRLCRETGQHVSDHQVTPFRRI